MFTPSNSFSMPAGKKSLLVVYDGFLNTGQIQGGSAAAAEGFCRHAVDSELFSVVHATGSRLRSAEERCGVKFLLFPPEGHEAEFIAGYDIVVFVSALDRFVRTPKPPGARWFAYCHCWGFVHEAKPRTADLDEVIALSEPHAQQLRKDIGTDIPISVLPNYIDTAHFRSNGAPRNPLSIMFCGAIVPHKGIHLLMEAFIGLKARLPQLELDVYGSASMWSYEPDFERMLRENLGHLVHFHGAVDRDRLVEAYSSHSILCLPSDLECFPLVTLEAQACGCIVVAHDTGGTRAAVHPGSGVLYAPNTPENIALALVRALEKLQREPNARNGAVQWTQANFSLEQAKFRHRELFARLSLSTRELSPLTLL